MPESAFAATDLDLISEPAEAGRMSVDSGRDAGGDARHHGIAGDGHAPAIAEPMVKL